MTTRSLTVDEARARAALLTDLGYEVRLDLDTGERTFESTSTVRFSCTEPGASTFLDVSAETVHQITLNGRSLDPAAVVDGRIVLEDLDSQNEVAVVATMRYSNDGQGLHRSVDPEDSRHYVYGHLFLDAAPRVFACFDQPDLKAPYDLIVRAPADWTVLGNAPATPAGDGQWRLTTTVPLATYLVTVCAGPWVSVTDEYDGIPLGIHARAGLGERLREQAEDIFTTTRQCLEYFPRLFGIRYPFGEYHQVFVPEFNAGAMENPGCVTLRDQMIHRGAATDEERLERAVTIAHEMAHMWFGDLVTMRWWDDLWLNESFAEYLGSRACAEATPYRAVWTDFCIARKGWGYAAERCPSTHPVAGQPAPDAAQALQNFDGISYAKGASVLRQLARHLGQDSFDAGLRDHLARHAGGNADLADLLTAFEDASGEDLDEWAEAWLRTAGCDTIRVDIPGDGSRAIGASLLREVPSAYPAARAHTLDVAGFEDGEELWRVDVELDEDDDEVDLPGILGRRVPHLVLPNAGDLTWATVRLAPRTIQALPAQLPQVPDPLARAVAWVALYDGVCLATVDPRQYARVLEAAWPAESDPSIAARSSARLISRVVPLYLPAARRGAALASFARVALARVTAALDGEPGPDQPGPDRLAAARRVAETSDDLDLLRSWVEGTGLPEDLAADRDLRWLAVTTLAARGAVDAAGIEEVLAGDDTLTGNLAALTARAALPDPAAKAWAWAELTGDGGQASAETGRSNYERLALARGFWLGEDVELLRPYVARYLEDLPALTGVVGPDALARLAGVAFPFSVAEQATEELVAGRLAGDLDPLVRRAVEDALSELRQGLRSQRRYG